MSDAAVQNRVVERLRRGDALRIYRRDDPLLPWLMEQVDAGVFTAEMIQLDEQSSCYRFALSDAERTRLMNPTTEEP